MAGCLGADAGWLAGWVWCLTAARRYYLDGAYREAVARAWAALPAKQQEYVTAFLGRLGYHPSVHLDEWQAYHTTESRNFWGISLQDVDLPQPALLATSSSAHGASTASSRSRR